MSIKQAYKTGFLSKFAISQQHTRKGIEVEVLKGKKIIEHILIENGNDFELINNKLRATYGLTL